MICSNCNCNTQHYYYIDNNIIGDVYEELAHGYQDSCKEEFFKLYLVGSIKDGLVCIKCINELIYSNDIEIDYVNPWLAYEPLPNKIDVCKYYKLDIEKYNPKYIKPEDRLNRKNGYIFQNIYKYPSIKTILEPNEFNEHDNIIDCYNKMKLNPELFGELSKRVVDNLEPLDYYLTKYDNNHNIKNWGLETINNLVWENL